ncbi:MAG: cytochrome c [Rhodospirillaceae bacterium]|nr:cytochrome c [Rhodospirillaceae bacterium]MBT5455571.1 cytochrome c [Rhodospirillaceae bacterium]
MRIIQIAAKFGVAGLFLGGLALVAGDMAGAAGQSRPAKLVVPELSDLAKTGNAAFDQTCAKCHGTHGVGTDKGPPLLHPVYNPGHHGDAAFYRAVKSGSRQHHWRFGNMPPQPHITEKQIGAIIRYVREIQEANGIVFRRHRM